LPDAAERRECVTPGQTHMFRGPGPAQIDSNRVDCGIRGPVTWPAAPMLARMGAAHGYPDRSAEDVSVVRKYRIGELAREAGITVRTLR
jgi:hypothetical protein